MISPEFIITLEQLDTWICLYMWAFSRLMGAFLMMPPYGELLPGRERIVFALILVLPIFPTLNSNIAIESAFSAKSFFILMGEFITGMTLGFIPALYLSIFSMAGNIIAMQMGLGMAQINDPVSGTVIPTVSQFYYLCSLIVFFSVNGHMVIVASLLESFNTIPLGAYHQISTKFQEIVLHTSYIWLMALLIATPSIFSLLVIMFALSFMARAAPQLNLMSIGFPASLLAGLAILAFTNNSFIDAGLDIITEMLTTFRNLSGLND